MFLRCYIVDDVRQDVRATYRDQFLFDVEVIKFRWSNTRYETRYRNVCYQRNGDGDRDRAGLAMRYAKDANRGTCQGGRKRRGRYGKSSDTARFIRNISKDWPD